MQGLAEAFAKAKGRSPSKREVEVLVRESRADKLADISTQDVRARQRAELSREEAQALDTLVRGARSQAPRQQLSQGQTMTVLQAALRHVYERTSVVRCSHLAIRGRCSQSCTPGSVVAIGVNSPRTSAGASGFMSHMSR